MARGLLLLARAWPWRRPMNTSWWTDFAGNWRSACQEHAATPPAVEIALPDTLLSMAVSSRGRLVATGTADGYVRIWDLVTGAPVCEPVRQGGKVLALAFHPNGKALVAGGDDAIVRIWDTATGVPLSEPLDLGLAVKVAAFSPDGKMFITAHARFVQRWSYAPCGGSAGLWNMTLTSKRCVLHLMESVCWRAVAAWQTSFTFGMPSRERRSASSASRTSRILPWRLVRTAQDWQLPALYEACRYGPLPMPVKRRWF